MQGIIFSLFLIFISSLILWFSCSRFDIASKKIGKRLTDGVRGATINAIGSSLPELFTALFFLFILQDITGFSAGLATIVGSAIFNILLIPAIVKIIIVKQKKTVEIKKKIILRDSIFLLLSQSLLLFFLHSGKGEITLLESSILLLVYVIYNTTNCCCFQPKTVFLNCSYFFNFRKIMF